MLRAGVPHLTATSPGSSKATGLFPHFNVSFPVTKSSVSPGSPAPLQALVTDCQWQFSTCLSKASFTAQRFLVFSWGFFYLFTCLGIFVWWETYIAKVGFIFQYMNFCVLFSCNSSISTNRGHITKIWVSLEWILGGIPCCKYESTVGNTLMLNTRACE